MIRTVLTSNLALLLQYVASSLIPLLLMPHIVGVIGLPEYGRLAVMLAAANISAVVVQYAFGVTGAPKLLAAASLTEEFGVFSDVTAAKLVLLLLVSLALFFFVACTSFSWFPSWIELALLSLLPSASALNSVWFLQAKNRFPVACGIAVLGAMISLLVGFVCIRPGVDNASMWALLACVLSAAISGAGSLIVALMMLGRRWISVSLSGLWREIGSGWVFFASQLISICYASGGPLCVVFFAGQAEAGKYALMERVLSAVGAALALTHTAAYPMLVRMYAGNRLAYWRLLFVVAGAYCGLGLLFSLFAWLLRHEFLDYLYHAAVDGEEGILLSGLVWLSICGIGSVLTGYCAVSRREWLVWRLTLAVLIVSVAVGVPSLKAAGAAGWFWGLASGQFVVLVVAAGFWFKGYWGDSKIGSA